MVQWSRWFTCFSHWGKEDSKMRLDPYVYNTTKLWDNWKCWGKTWQKNNQSAEVTIGNGVHFIWPIVIAVSRPMAGSGVNYGDWKNDSRYTFSHATCQAPRKSSFPAQYESCCLLPMDYITRSTSHVEPRFLLKVRLHKTHIVTYLHNEGIWVFLPGVSVPSFLSFFFFFLFFFCLTV